MAQQHRIQIVVEGKDQGASSTLESLSGKVKSLGGSISDFGGKLTAGVTLPLVSIGGAAIKMSTDLNAAMANIGALGVGQERLEELKVGIQEVAIETGKSTDDIAGGAYQVISAFGDTADTLEIVRVNAMLAAAGLSTTEEAIALTSAVTKAYNDTSIEAVGHVADLALATVRYGQTTLPELASAYGKTTALGNALGISQEELAATFATATGVTGNTAEVATQMAATFQSLIRPTGEMSTAIGQVSAALSDQGILAEGPLTDAWNTALTTLIKAREEMGQTEKAMAELDTSTKSGAAEFKKLEKRYKDQKSGLKDFERNVDAAAAALGPAIIESVGFGEAIRLLSDEADGNLDMLTRMLGSVEAARLVLALGGAQAEDYATKLEAMQNVSGSLTEAFKAQTQGINANGFTMKQLQSIVQVLMQRLGDGLAPALTAVLRVAMPVADWLMEMSKRFVALDEKTQTWIVGIAATVAALGPALMVFGQILTVASTLTPVMGALGAAIGLIASPIGLVIGGLIALGVALYAFDIGGFKGMIDGMVESLGKLAEGFTTFLSGADFAAFKTEVTGAFGNIWEAVTGFFSGDVSLDSLGSAITTGFDTIKQAVADLFAGTDFEQFLTDIEWSEFVEKLTWENFVSTMTSWGDYIKGIDWTKFVIDVLDWASMVPALSWNFFVWKLEWATYIGAFVWSEWLSKIDWGDLVNPIDWADWITSIDWAAMGVSVLDWASYVGSIAWENFVAKLDWPDVGIEWSEFVEKLTWENFVSTMTNWGDYIKGIDWTQFIINTLDWVSYIPALSWNFFVWKLEWGAYIGQLVWSQWLSKIDWKKTIDAIIWSDWITAPFDWALFVVSLNWGDWIESALDWSKYVFKIVWSNFVDKLKWPKIDLDWKQFIPEFPGWASFWSSINPFGGGSGTTTTEGQSSGTRFWRGGLSWVGEEGPELVNLPRGAQVFNSQRQMELAGVTAGGVTINATFAINNTLDAQVVANQVLDIIRRGSR